MNKLQRTELEILKEFIRVCELLGLRYYLVCGSALGAVKYQGFIPWDDDIDVALLRDDYEVFIEKAQDLLPDHIFVQNYKTDVRFPYIYTKIRNSNTTYIEKSSRELPINHGVYIDVFPLDGYPEGKMAGQIFEIRKRIYTHMLSTAFTEPAGFKSKVIYRFKRMIGFQNSTAKTAEKYEKMLKSYPVSKSSLWCNHGNWQGKLEYAPKRQYNKGIRKVFAGLEVIVPEDYHEYLTQKYGDYTKELPEDEQKGHHYYTVCDCEHSYLEYM